MRRSRDRSHKENAWWINLKKSGTKKLYLYLLLFTAFAVSCAILFGLGLYRIPIDFIAKYSSVFFWLGEFLLAAFYVFCIVVTVKSNDKLIKIGITAYVLFVFCLVVLAVLVRTGFFYVVNSVEELRAYIERAGSWTWFIFILLQFLQVVLLPIPGMVSTTVGIALFGPFRCMIFSLIGIELGSLTAFIVGRNLGYKAVAWLVGKDDLDKWMRKLKGKDSFLLTLMFLFPLFPDDILCFVAGLSSMSFKYFFVMTLITRSISVAATCYSVNFIPFNTWWGLLIWGALIVAVVVAFVFVYKNMDRIQEKIKKIKKK